MTVTSLLIVGMSVITFVNRFAFFSQMIKYQPSVKAKRFLSYSSYAILTAIWAPIVFSAGSASEFGFSHAGLDYLLASVLAAVLSIARIKSIFVVLLSTGLFFSLRYALI